MPPSISGSIATRFTWTYNRAASAMLTTTATTVFCLLLNVTAPFPMFQTFGIFNAFVVICNYILCITWCVASEPTQALALALALALTLTLSLSLTLSLTRRARRGCSARRARV